MIRTFLTKIARLGFSVGLATSVMLFAIVCGSLDLILVDSKCFTIKGAAVDGLFTLWFWAGSTNDSDLGVWVGFGIGTTAAGLESVCGVVG